MKKQIFTLTMCLALTTTSALAEGTKTITNKVSAPVAKSQITSVPTQATRPTEITLPQQFEARKKFEERKAQERELMYTTLGLSAEQKVKLEAIDAKTRAEAGKYLRKVQVEAKKLKDLKAKHASFFAIYKQKHALKVAKHKAHKFFESSRKSFEAVLTKEQLEKFKILNEAKKKELQEFRKDHAHHGTNGFGPGPEHMGLPQGFGPKGPHDPEQIGPAPQEKK